MKLEDAIEKSERMHTLLVDPAPGNEPHDIENLIVADAKLKNHCRKQLPRLLRAIAAKDAAFAAYREHGIAAARDASVKFATEYQRTRKDLDRAHEEYDAAIATAKEVPDA